ncbi:MAG: CPBP family intramembrane metalloprotease [Burkholderiaceae bacterium]|nr:CPBP family intramembrane metalloprotease [Burkholderiaceae bacterium]
MATSIFRCHKQILILWFLGLLGVISVLPVVSQLIAIQNRPLPFSILQLQVITFIQSGLLILGAVVLGSIFSPKVNLSAPVVEAILKNQPILTKLKPQIVPAFLGGILGGVFIFLFSLKFQGLLPPEFLLSAKKLSLPWSARIFYGGISEELLVRWGLMSFLAWLFLRCFQNSASQIKPIIYIASIFVSAFVFGLAHLPAAFALSPAVTTPLVFYILVGNAFFGFVAGGLYWKYGLECAIFSHMLAHVTLLILEPMVIA